MPNWEYEILIGPVGEVKEALNRMGRLGWELAATNVLAMSGAEATLVVYMKRFADPEVPERPPADLHEFPAFRPGS